MSETTCGQCGVTLGDGPGVHACEVRTYRCEVCGEDHRREELETCYVKDQRRVDDLERRLDALANRLDMLAEKVERGLERLKYARSTEHPGGITGVGAGESLARAMESPVSSRTLRLTEEADARRQADVTRVVGRIHSGPVFEDTMGGRLTHLGEGCWCGKGTRCPANAGTLADHHLRTYGAPSPLLKMLERTPAEMLDEAADMLERARATLRESGILHGSSVLYDLGCVIQALNELRARRGGM